ncbi:MAG: hypothetical protein ACJ71T_16320 [Actinomycetales bacterium]
MPSHLITRKTVTAAAAAVAGSALLLTGLVGGPASAATRSGVAPASATSSAAAAATTQQVARWGAGYLARQITANGGFIAPFGAPDLSNTAYSVLGLHAAGVGGTASGQAIAWLKTQVATGLAGSDGRDDPGRLGFTILAAVSAGEDPRHFGGSQAKNNLVGRLLATARTSGSDAGLFGTSDPTFDGAFRQGAALAALRSAGVAKTRVAPELAWLTGQQCANGMWTSYRPSVATPCPPADPNTFSGPDTNSTGLAIQGLAAYGEQPRRAHTLATFHAIQSPDGGFPFLTATGQTSDPNSTALSIQGLLADGVGTGLTAFRVGGATPYDALAAYQLGCSAPARDRGAFFFPGVAGANVLATVQAVPAMAKATLPVPTSTPTASAPRMPCTLAQPAQPAQPAQLALAGTAGACPGTTKGVTVAVDFTAFGGKVQVRCAPGTPTTGVAALQQAGFTPAGTALYGLAFVCRINNKPAPAQQACLTTPPANAYWAYYHANKGATTWTFSTQGASTYKPAQGSIDAWAFGNTAKPSKTPAQVRKVTG